MAGATGLDDLETVDFDGVDILATGGPYFGTGSPAEGDFYTEDDLRTIAENTRKLMESGELYAPLKLGHSVDQKLAKESGYSDGEMPALGWVANPRVENGRLVTDLKRVPRKLAALIKSGAFRTRSVELRSYVSQRDGRKYGPAIKGLALMGAKTPAVRTLSDIVALYSDEVEEADVETREYGEVIWNPDMGYRWVQKEIAGAINPEGESRFYVADVGPTTALITSDGANAEAWVVPFGVNLEDEVEVAPASEWIRADSRWVEKARAYSEQGGENPADTNRKMEVNMTENTEQEFESAPESDEEEGKDENEYVRIPTADWEAVKAAAEAGQSAERKLAEMERERFLEEAARGGKIDPAEMDDWRRRYDEQPEFTTEIVSSLKPREVYLREYGSDADGRNIEDDMERALGDALDDYMGIPEDARIGGRS